MRVLIDNYDSFTYNLYQLVGAFDNDLMVVKNDEISLAKLIELEPTGLILSPGPGRPEDAGISLEAARYFAGKIPILGVCMGLEVICETFGGQLTYARRLMHGKIDQMTLDNTDPLFKDCPRVVNAARYHSLVVDQNLVPNELCVTAHSSDGDIMALSQRQLGIYGVQFHPESIMTDNNFGRQLVQNFLNIKIPQEKRLTNVS
ncbi:anthranilate synthase component II [Paucilactobacillus hokkaidonensis JCM 18461]|uniref:Anthranilate synthase component II n=1 Tax=Paucilactobacillus hokkaidonensis JCM 18461 TaxID=1291742 RepID=A0A0A1GWV1_9LACO|nr:aminodeoxychorismate/anthranilate synthase component II [Paucilactobacillus hokkaidonensis]BAP86642.1 anthranilate synthase component II [Paucilactobacillus hokkaidonensis JCM 18461]